jgi:hypothetical protein
MKITEKEFNVVTGEETIFEREETAEELQARIQAEAEAETAAVLRAETAAAKAAAQSKLEALGLTNDDLKALGL